MLCVWITFLLCVDCLPSNIVLLDVFLTRLSIGITSPGRHSGQSKIAENDSSVCWVATITQHQAEKSCQSKRSRSKILIKQSSAGGWQCAPSIRHIRSPQLLFFFLWERSKKSEFRDANCEANSFTTILLIPPMGWKSLLAYDALMGVIPGFLLEKAAYLCTDESCPGGMY